jgi:translation initiation factor IF-2
VSRATPGAPQPAPGGPGAPRRGRPHPTGLRVEPGAAPPVAPTEAQRRAPDKRRTTVDRDLQAEREERDFRRPSLSRRDREDTSRLAAGKEVTISEGITVKELSEKLGLKANLVIKKLVEKKIFATINQTLDAKTADELARTFGAATTKMTFEEEAIQEVDLAEDPKELVRRAPVVTIMGHVDHGKTSLLDSIRLSNVADREAGGITQHIGAYSVEKSGQRIVFIDTPGHEAFTRMRARGAKVTDVVILVVAADDGVMPQTVEAMDHAKAAGVPIIVAVNKIDKPDAQPERVKQQLSDRGLVPEQWGGDTVMVPVSAKTKENIDGLLEMVLLVSEMADLKSNPGRPGVGTVLEAKLDKGRGPVATLLVQNGSLRVGDYYICGSVFGKVRAMYDDRGNQVREAGPSTPVEVLGLESLPEVGDLMQVVTDTAKAKQIVVYREAKAREQAMARSSRLTLDQLHEQIRTGEVKELPIIIKADVGGSAEVLTETLQKLSNEKVKVRVISSGVGAINEGDVLLASASNAVVIGFNVRPDRNAASVAEQEKVDVRLHTIIYELTDEVRKAMTGMLEPVFKEVYKGRAEVRETFRITKVGNVAGCHVLDGNITRDSEVRVLRDNVVVHTGKVGSLRRFKDDVSEVKSGMECGITLASFGDVKPGDILEAFTTVRVATEALV